VASTTVTVQVLSEVDVRSQPEDSVLARTGFPAGAIVSVAGALLIVGGGLSLLGHRRIDASS
jgi:hypothetical protein